MQLHIISHEVTGGLVERGREQFQHVSLGGLGRVRLFSHCIHSEEISLALLPGLKLPAEKRGGLLWCSDEVFGVVFFEHAEERGAFG